MCVYESVVLLTILCHYVSSDIDYLDNIVAYNAKFLHGYKESSIKLFCTMVYK